MSGGVQTHELRLKINAAAAETGATRFRSAIAAIRRAVQGLEKDSTGAFLNLKKGMSVSPGRGAETALNNTAKAANRTEQASQRLAVSVKNSMVTATGQAQRLRDQFEAMGNVSGLKRVEAALAKLQARAAAAGNSTELGAAKADYRQSVAGLTAEARAMEQAAKAAAHHATETDGLRKRHDEIFAVSKRYEASLAEIAELEARGALTAEKAAAARARAAQQLEAGAVAVGKYGNALKVSQYNVTNFSNEMFDLTRTGRKFDMRQVAMQLSQVGQQGAVTGNYLQALMIQLPDLALGFGPVGIAAGAVAGVLGTVLVGALTKTSDEAEEAKNKVHALSEALDALEGNTSASAAQIQQHLNKTFKGAAGEVQALIEDLRDAEFSVISRQMQKEVEKVSSDLNRLGGAYEVFWADFMNPGSVESGYLKQTQEIIAKAGMAYGEFQQLDAAVKAVFTSKDVTEFVTNLSAAGAIAEKIGGPVGDQIAAAMLQAAKDGGILNRVMSDAAGQTVEWGGAMQGVLSTIEAIKASLSSIGGGVLSNAEKEAELKALREGKSVRDAAVAAQRFQREAEWKGRDMAAGGGIAGWAQRRLIDMERAQFERGLALDAQLDDARSASRTAGGRAKLTDSVERTIDALEKENMALEAQRLGIVNTDAAARMYADAILASGGNLSAAQLESIKYADSLELVNQRLRETTKESAAAGDGLAGMGKTAQSALESGIRDAFMGGSSKEIFRNFARSVQGAIADSLSKKIVSSLGLENLFNIGGQTAAMQMQGAIVAGSAQGAAMMAQAVSTGAVTAGAASAAGTGGNWLSSFFGLFFKEGGISDQPSAVNKIPQYAEGTPNTSGGIPSILHPNEAVIPLSRGRKVPVEMSGGGNSVGDITINAPVTVQGDASPETAIEIAKRAGETIRGVVQEEIALSLQYGGTANPRGGW